MLTLSKEIAALTLGVVRAQQRQSRVYRHCTHLTIDRNGTSGIQEDEGKYYGPKGGKSRKGVNLLNTKRIISPGTGVAEETEVRRIYSQTHIVRR